VCVCVCVCVCVLLFNRMTSFPARAVFTSRAFSRSRKCVQLLRRAGQQLPRKCRCAMLMALSC
jgi:hypothetical protein